VPQLRWILLGAGIALILGLWWWETRKSKSKTAADAGEAWPRERAEPMVEPVAGAATAEPPLEPATYAPTIERVRVPRRPPMIEIPDDLEVDVSAYVGKDRRRLGDAEPAPAAEAVPAKRVADAASEGAEPEAELDEQQDDHHRAPWIRTHPLERSEIAPKPEEEPPEPLPADSIERQTAEASQQRIVALRLVAPDGGWPGQALREALEAEGLRFGRYSIYHREREDGKTLIYVASMLEPGSFDPVKMDEQVFPGISLFGIVPGPIDAPATFDLVLAVGRRLADRIKGQLQDEQGSTLTAQRILNLREELVHFEHRYKRLRRG
jgi:cell division protein ZipA